MGQTADADLYQQLLNLARRKLGPHPAHTLGATGLAHEAWLRLEKAGSWRDQPQPFQHVARTLRAVLVDHSRRRAARKRGGDSQRSPLWEGSLFRESAAADLLALHEALERLAHRTPFQARLVELRFFAGLDIAQTASALGCSTATVKREWRTARAWLFQQMSGEA